MHARLWKVAAIGAMAVLAGFGLQAAATAAPDHQPAAKVKPALGNLSPVGESVFHAVTPTRILDTRSTLGGHNSPLGAGATLDLQVTGTSAVPAGATAVAFNLTAVGPTAGSFLTVYPQGTTRPTVSSINVTAGQTLANFGTVKLAGNGQVTIFNSAGSVNVILDVAGYYAPSVAFGSAGYVGWALAGDAGISFSNSNNGGAVTLTNNGTGSNTITFHGAGIPAFLAADATVQVSVAGSTNNDTCITLAGVSGSDLNVAVRCFHTDGSAADDLFYLFVAG